MVEAIGEQFDPQIFHEAVSEMADDGIKPGTVIKDLQKGVIPLIRGSFDHLWSL